VDFSSLLTLSGFILTVLAIMANAYWQDAVRWDKVRLEALKKKHDEIADTAKICVGHAKGIFRVAALMGFWTSLSIILELPHHVRISSSPPAILLTIVLILLTAILLVLTVIPKYKIPIETSEEYIKLHTFSASTNSTFKRFTILNEVGSTSEVVIHCPCCGLIFREYYSCNAVANCPRGKANGSIGAGPVGFP
jgi:hypothetical protein